MKKGKSTVKTEQFEITLMLELSKELKITTINVKSYIKGKQHARKDGKFQQREIWKFKWNITNKKMCNSRYRIAEEGISEFDDRSNYPYRNTRGKKVEKNHKKASQIFE